MMPAMSWTQDEVDERLAAVREALLHFLGERHRLEWFEHRVRWRLSRRYIWPARSPEEREAFVYYFSVGSTNMDYRSMVMDGEVDNDATLAAVRLRYHIVKNWDGMVEYHWLDSDASATTRSGGLLAAYRHIGDNLKVGVGYNFTDFDDDLGNTDFDAKGWFINVIGKY